METNNTTSWRDARRVPSMRVQCAKGGCSSTPLLIPHLAGILGWDGSGRPDSSQGRMYCEKDKRRETNGYVCFWLNDVQ